MNNEQMLASIREINFSYTILAREMIQRDCAVAMFRLGISIETADCIDNLTLGEIMKISESTNVLMCRFDDPLILELLAGKKKRNVEATSHAALLMIG